MRVWFTSDLHFGHARVAEFRGFDDVAAHDDAIREQWLEQVDRDDTVWVLGDLCVSRPAAALEIIADLTGRKHLIAGNHDACHPMHRQAAHWQPIYLKAFESVQPFARRKIDGHSVLLSHFPYEADRHVKRYGQYRLPDEGAFLLHGHTHSNVSITSDREIHVGWDAWQRLVSLEDVAEIISRQRVP